MHNPLNNYTCAGYCKVCEEAYEMGIEDGYNKAIDNFVNRIKSRKGYFEEYYPNDSVAIAEANVYLHVAEQLKRGVEDEID